MGYIRARRSIRLGPGVKLNLNKRSVGLSVGGRGAHYSMNTSGRRTTTVGVPGTGLSYVHTRGGHRAPTRAAAPAAVPAEPAPFTGRRAGLFAPHYEKAFAKGVREFAAGNAKGALVHFAEASDADTQNKAISDDLLAGLASAQTGDTKNAITYLEKVVSSKQELPDELMLKYIPHCWISATFADDVRLTIELGSAAAVIVLATCYEQAGFEASAAELLQQLATELPDPGLKLALADMLAKVEDWDRLLEATAGITNVDEGTLRIRLLQARAMEAKGLDEAALEVYKDALRSKKRDADTLKLARYRRALLYEKLGKQNQARRELSRLYAEDPSYEDVASRLEALAS